MSEPDRPGLFGTDDLLFIVAGSGLGRIFGLWMACHTQQEIEDTEGEPRETIRDISKGFGEIGNLAESAKAHAFHADDFEPPIYNIWKQQTTRRIWTEEVCRLFLPQRAAPFPCAAADQNLGEVVKDLCRRDREAVDLLDQVMQKPVGVHHDSNNVTITNRGNTAAAALRRLRKDRPDLHRHVLDQDHRKGLSKRMSDLGATQRPIAQALGVNVATVNRDLAVANATVAPNAEHENAPDFIGSVAFATPAPAAKAWFQEPDKKVVQQAISGVRREAQNYAAKRKSRSGSWVN